jgi:alpha-N-acetylglucosamine transferase
MKITMSQFRQLIREEIQKVKISEAGIGGLINKMYDKYNNDLEIKKAWMKIPKDQRFQDGYEKLSPSEQKEFEELLKEALKTNTEASANHVVMICKFIVESNKFDRSLVDQCERIIQLAK